jgi:hypothetical protein
MNEEGRAPLGSWRAFHALVIGVLVVLIVLFSLATWHYR